MRQKRTQIIHRAAAREAFSLLELTLVLVIIGLLSGVAAVALVKRGEQARIDTTHITMNTYKTNIEQYMVANSGKPPANLNALFPTYLQPTNTGDPTPDAWENQFYYSPEATSGGKPFRLISSGPDGQFDTDDDIDLWLIGVGEQQ